jgi:general secretion pathway protein G
MIALALVSIIATLGYPSYTSYYERVDAGSVEKDFLKIELVMAKYFAAQGSYPASLAAVGMDMDDPWGNPYEYLNMALTNGNGQKRKDRNQVPINTDFDLYSKGPDGKSASPLTSANSQDDIIRANNGAYIGLASEY